MINKGRIHKELGKFFRYLWKSIKSDDELRLEMRKFSVLRKITLIQIHRIKNQEIWSRIRGEIEVWNWEKIQSWNLMKNQNWTEIKLNLQFKM